jgi:glycerophosphoryl diester phosphodiesterase
MIVGHRGVPALHQENTLAGFRRAIALGIPAVELDVRLTKDHKLVVFHDGDVSRMTGRPGVVAQMTWDQVAKLRVRRDVPMGIRPDGTTVMARYEKEERIPLLAEVLTEIAPKAAINVELKLDMARWWHVDVAAATAKVIHDLGVEDRVMVTSFDPRKLLAAGRASERIALGFCFDDGMFNFVGPLLDRVQSRLQRAAAVDGDDRPFRSARRLLSRLVQSNWVGRFLHTHAIGAEHTLVDRDTVDGLHAQGVPLGVHTIFPIGSTTGKAIPSSSSSHAEVERLCEIGVDWIETDDPERLQNLIG